MKIYISGSVAYDEIMDFPSLFKDYFHPEKLHQINVSFVVSSLAKHFGGIATNISYALRNTVDYYPSTSSGQVTISPVASVGRDGAELLAFFQKNNIDTSFVQQDSTLYTATGKVITDKKDNQIWGFYYGASALDPQRGILSSNRSAEGEFWVVSATHINPFTKVLHHVIKNKLPYLFDPGMTLTWISDELLKTGVMNAQFVVGNDYEISMIEKRLGLSVKEMGVKGVNVITTLGEKGVTYHGLADMQPSRRVCTMNIKAYEVKKTVDPTGAGDAWRGGFTGALAAGKSIKECLLTGNVMASFAVETVGTVEYVTNKSEIARRIRSIQK